MIECSNRADSGNRCSGQEIRNNIGMIGFSGISAASGITLTVMEAGGPAGVAVGTVMMAGQGIYSGISNVIEYEDRYHMTLGEDWSIFWRTLFLQSMSKDVEHLALRSEMINNLTQTAWNILNNRSSNVVAYAIGLGKEKIINFIECKDELYYVPGADYTFYSGSYIYHRCSKIPHYIIEPAYSKINLYSSVNTTNTLSRVQPKSIANATMICLPKVTGDDYEKGKVQSNADAVYACDNAIVMVHKQREDLNPENKSKYIIYDLNLVNSGDVVASNEHNNIFEIFEGDTKVSGGKNLNNIFNIRNDTYHGKINLGSNSTNVIDVRNPSNGTISIQYVYACSMNQTICMNITTDSSVVDIIAIEPIEKIKYVSASNKVDKIVCKNLLNKGYESYTTYDDNIAHNHIIIDSGRGTNDTVQDTIQGCRNVIVSPNTIVTGDDGNYTIYINSKNANFSYAASNIHIPGIGIKTIKFPEISLLNDVTSIKYNASRNGLTINIPLLQNGQYALELKNYLTNPNRTSYLLIDKDDKHIVPILDNDTQSHDVNNFFVDARVTSNLEAQALIMHYQNITYTTHTYNIIGIVRTPNNDVWHFGSVDDDIIQNDDNTIFMSGGQGSDLYVITQTKKYLNLLISNHATDLALDILRIPSILTDVILTRNGDHLVLDLLLGSYITILDYFKSKEDQHIALIDQNNDIFMAFAIEQGIITLIPREEGIITLIPFCHKTLSKNIFRFFSTEKHIVIDIDEKDILFYPQENDLFITEQAADNVYGLNIILTDYFSDKQQWLEVKLYAYKNGVISRMDWDHIQMSYMSYQNFHDSVIQTYVLDLTNGSNYVATTKDHHTNVSDRYSVILSDKKLTLFLFKDTPLKRLVVENSRVDDFVYKDNLYKGNMFEVHNWINISRKHHIFFEFDNGLEHDRIYLSNTTIARIKLNNEIDKKTDGNTTVEVIEGLMLHCMPSNMSNPLPNYNQLSYSFLKEELDYRKKGSINNGV